MKGLFLKIFVVGLVLSACASGPVRTIPSLSNDVRPGPNQSEVIIRYSSSILHKAKGMLNVFVDGEMVAQVMADTSERIIIPNGSHTIGVGQSGKRDINISNKFEANSQRIVFNVLRVLSVLALTKESETALAAQSVGIIGAARTSANNLSGKLPSGANIAVLSISASDSNIATSVINELEFVLVNSGQYRIVDRGSIETIRSEQNFQMSGDVSDESAVSIGQMLGANIVITGSINETATSKVLTVKALDVRTAQIITMEREFY